ncbi:MFS transporter [Roseibium sp. Sym1]|uniref:MFS transporter n=1 Tax=Roseibium sp. Sym1 TaxID=3016006 RepID=UPI0022B5054C|nr:MFS transporter [Roseibium sp. Sym1]
MSVVSPARVPASPSLFAPERAAGTLALMLGVGSHAINGFVTTAVLPDIIRDLGGQDRAFWVFSSFEMMAILAGCLTGAAKVRFSARLPFLLATLLLAGGSVLAGLSTSLEGLIAGRALQGFGEGMIIAPCYALIPDLFPQVLVPRVFAMLAGVWAMAAGFGPVSAGLLADLWSWRAAFLINLPLVLLLFILMNTALPSHAARPAPDNVTTGRSGRFGLRLLLLVVSIFLLTVIGELHEPLPLALTTLAGLAVAGLLFKVDAGSARRLFPRDAFRLRTMIGLGTWIVILISVAAAVRAIFVTTIGQVLWGLSVTEASYVTALLALSWSVFALISSRAPTRQRELAYLGTGPFLVAGGLGLTAIAIDVDDLWVFAAASIVTGAGHGLCNQILLRSLMYSADGEDRNLVSGILPTISSAGIAIGGGLTGLLAIMTGLVAPGDTALLGKEAVIRSGASVFYINAALTLLPAFAMLVLRRRLMRQEVSDP